MTKTDVQSLPVAGYQAQPVEKIATVNLSKAVEEGVLRFLDGLATHDFCDKRWLAIARTHIEQGFMAANRAVFQPQRLTDAEMAKAQADAHALVAEKFAAD